MRERKVSVLFLYTFGSVTWTVSPKIDIFSNLIPRAIFSSSSYNEKMRWGRGCIFSYFFHVYYFERDIIFKESLFCCTYWNKSWSRFHWIVFWKNTEMYPETSRQLRWNYYLINQDRQHWEGGGAVFLQTKVFFLVVLPRFASWNWLVWITFSSILTMSQYLHLHVTNSFKLTIFLSLSS